MYGKPQYLPPKSDDDDDNPLVLLRPHWQYHVKRCGTRRSRQCVDGSKRSDPVLHALANSDASCVDQPVQRLFLAISALKNNRLYGGDARDAFTHAFNNFTQPTFCAIDAQYAEWYFD